MKNIAFRFFTPIMMLLCVTGCSKQHESPSVKESLTGTWQWVETQGGLFSHIHETPQSTGKNVELQFKSDGTFAEFTNYSLTSSGSYTLEKRKCIHDHTEKAWIKFSTGKGEMMIEHINQETLDLSDENFDGTGSSYKRKIAIE